MQSTRSSRDDRLADVAGAGEQVDDSGRQVVEARRQHQGRERRQLRRLADGRVAGRQRRRELPGEQQQRVVPRHDAADHADRLLQHERELRRLDRRDHAAGAVAPDLGVVVERGGGPADLVGVLDQRLAALERHHARELVGALAQQRAPPRAAPRRARRPACAAQSAGRLGARRRSPRRPARRDGAPTVGQRLLRGGVLDGQRGAVARHLLAADQQSRLELGPSDALRRARRSRSLQAGSVHRALSRDHDDLLDLLVGELLRQLEGEVEPRPALPRVELVVDVHAPGRRRPSPCGRRTSRPSSRCRRRG